MDFLKLQKMRQSTRHYQPQQITEQELKTILAAGNAAPVGSGLYQDIHLTVVQNPDVLDQLCEAAGVRFSSRKNLEEIVSEELEQKSTASQTEARGKNPNLFYGAPTVIFVSNRKQTVQPGIEYSNVMSVAAAMHYAATELGLGSCYMWGALESMRMLPEYDHTDLLQIPEGFEPLIGLAVGYPAEALAEREMHTHPMGYNRIS